MGDILILAGIAGLALAVIAAPVAVVVLRRQARKLSEQIQREYEQDI